MQKNRNSEAYDLEKKLFTNKSYLTLLTLRCWFEGYEFHLFTILQLFLPKNLLLLFDVNGEYIDYENKDFNIIVCYGQSDCS